MGFSWARARVPQDAAFVRRKRARVGSSEMQGPGLEPLSSWSEGAGQRVGKEAAGSWFCSFHVSSHGGWIVF